MKSVSIFAATLTLAVAPLSANAAHEMKVFEGFASSRAVLEKRYEAAAAIAQERENSSNRFYRIVNATSLCVALVKMKRVEEGAQACGRAVDNLSGIRPEHKGMDRELIIETVLANQAVVAALQPAVAQR